MVITSTRLIRALTLGSDSILALAIFPCILIRGDIPEGTVRDRILLHEKIHLRQQLELLVLPFYLWYAASYLTGRVRGKGHFRTYLDIPFEKEAERNMTDPDYLAKRRSYAFLKYR